MNINPKDRRNYHRLTVEQKKELFTTIHKTVKASGAHYARMFTEPRSKGYRTKLWFCRELPTGSDQLAKDLFTNLKQSKVSYMIESVEPYQVLSGGWRHSHGICFYIKFS